MNDNLTGRIFDIQRYSIHDGAGIRTIVFLKGCVLRCAWCCNPESQEYGIQEMTINGKTKVMGRDVTVAEVMNTVKRDMPYYLHTTGGLTLSGGECLLQPDFSAALLGSAKELGLNTAIESMACVPYENIEKVLPYLDTYLMDIKHLDTKKHEKFTGKGNELMLQNAMKVAMSRQCELIIRVPVIPTFNDTDKEILQIAKFAEALPGVKQIHLLPYHNFGEGKYEGLNRDYSLKNVAKLPDGKIEHFVELVEKNTRLKSQVGG